MNIKYCLSCLHKWKFFIFWKCEKKIVSLADLELEVYLQGRLMAAFEEPASSQAEMFSNCASQCVRPSPFKSDPFNSLRTFFSDKGKLARSIRVWPGWGSAVKSSQSTFVFAKTRKTTILLSRCGDARALWNCFGEVEGVTASARDKSQDPNLQYFFGLYTAIKSDSI